MKNKSSKLAMLLSTLFILSGIGGVGTGIGLFVKDNLKNISSSNDITNDGNNSNNGSGSNGNNGNGDNNSGNNGNDSSANNNEIKFNNTILINLRNQINNYIFQNEFTFSDLENNLNELKDNLIKWTNNLLTSENIGDVKLSNENDILKLIITSNSKYKFTCSNSSKYFDNVDSTLVFGDLKFYTNIYFDNQNINQFKTKLQDYITNQQYINQEFKSYVESNEFKSFITSNLKTTFSEFVNEEVIGNSLFNLDTNTLTINPNEMYKFVLNSNTIENISISNFNFYSIRKLIKLNNLYDAIKDEITSKQFTDEQFANYIQINNSAIKNLLANNLYISENEKVSANEIKSVSYENNELLVTLNPPINTKYSIEDNDNISLANNVLTIKNLIYYKTITLTKLDSLYNAIQTEIRNKKYTSSEFSNYVQTNNLTIKNLVLQNLYISESTTINSNQVSTISYNNGIVNIKLLPPENTKYLIDQNNNVSFENNTLSVKNLNYCTVINFTRLDDLYNSIQTEINNQKQTSSEFISYVQNNNDQIRTLVANNLYISSSTTIQSNQIAGILVNNNNLEITLENIDLTKYSVDTNNNVSLSNNKLIISGLNYCTITKFIKLSDLHNAIQSEISSRKFTSSEFNNYVSTNNTTIKNIVADNLYISETTTIGLGLISSISYSNESLKVNLVNQSNVKYSIDTNPDFSLVDNILTITNFNYFTVVNLTNLNNLHNAIQNKITDNEWTNTEFSNYVQTQQSDIKTLVANNLWVSNNVSISTNQITSVSVNNQNLIVNLSPNANTKFSISSNSNFNLVDNVLTIKNFTFYTTTNFTRLNDLYNAVRNEIQNRSFTLTEFSDYISQNQLTIKQLIANNLYISTSTKFNVNNINSVSMNNSNLVITLNNIANVKYTADANANISLSNNKLTISNLSYYTIKKLIKLDTLHNAIQAEITSRHFTSSEFSDYVSSNNLTIKNIVASNLYISENITINSGSISSVSYSNGNLKVNLLKQDNTKYSIDSNSNFSLVDNVLTISNFSYFTIVTLSNLNNLHNAIQNKITDRKLTSDEFNNYVQSNQSEVKQLIINNLWVANNTSIASNQISTITSSNGNLVITLSPNTNTKFSISTNSNFSLVDNTLTIKNFTFTTVTNFTRLNDLYNAVNNEIKTKNYSSSEFNTYVSSNQTTIKQLVANNLYISSTNKFNVSNISSVSMSGNNLVVTLNNIANVKYSADINNNVSLNNNVLTISNLNYSQTINLTKLDVLYNAVNNYISESSRKYTVDEFKNNINVSPTTIRQLIADNLYINTSTKISIDKITNVAINSNNQLEITLDNTLVKYTISSYTNAELSSNKLIIKNLNYFNLISISDTNLTSLRDSIQNYITNNKVTSSNISNHISNINNLVSNIKTTNNQNLGNFVSSVTVSNNSISIPLNGNYKMNSKSLTNIEVNANNILLSNFTFYTENVTPPTPSVQESPEDWFTWNGNQITGTTELGSKKDVIVLPAKTTSITNNAFRDNNYIVSVDMSLTQIISIPDGNESIYFNSSYGTFYYCRNLAKIILPTNLSKIGISSFVGTKLTSVTIPDSVASIGDYAFSYCSTLSNIKLSNNLSSIGGYAFRKCQSLISINIPNSMNSINNNAFRECTGLVSIKLSNSLNSIGYAAFMACSSLTSINIPDGVTSIGEAAFRDCTKLNSIIMPDSVTSISSYAFLNVPRTCIMKVKKGWNTNLVNTASPAQYWGKYEWID